MIISKTIANTLFFYFTLIRSTYSVLKKENLSFHCRTIMRIEGANVSSINPEIFNQNPTITELIITHTSITELPKGMEVLKNVSKLHFVNNNRITDLSSLINLPQSFKDQITALVLSGVDVETIPEEINTFRNLEFLNLEYNKLKKLPDSLTTLVKLTNLIVSHNELETLPKNFGNLEKLKWLLLNNNNFTDLDLELIKLKEITVLYACNNRFTKMPVCVCLLKNLNDLKLINNRLQSMYPSADEIERAREEIQAREDLRNCINMNTDIQSQFYPMLRICDFETNEISFIPYQIKYAKQLSKINLSCNRIEKVAVELFELQKLFSVNLTTNRLRLLPFGCVPQHKQQKSKPFVQKLVGFFEEQPRQSDTRNSLQLDINDNFIEENDMEGVGYGTRTLTKLFPEINIGNQWGFCTTPDTAIDWYYKQNLHHWNVDRLREIKAEDDSMIKEAFDIKDSAMLHMWASVLQHLLFVLPENKVIYEQSESERENENETDLLIKQVQESDAFKMISRLEYTDEETKRNNVVIKRISEYLELHNQPENSPEANVNKIRIKSCIKLVFKQLLLEILEADDNTKLNEVRNKLIHLSAINEKNASLIDQMKVAMNCYALYYKKVPIVKVFKIKEFICEALVTLKNDYFIGTQISLNRWNVRKGYYLHNLFSPVIGITPLPDILSVEPTDIRIDELETIRIFSKFLKQFSIHEVATVIAAELNKITETVQLLHQYLLDEVRKSSEAKKYKNNIEKITEHVTKQYFKYEMIRSSASNKKIKEPIAINAYGVVRILEFLEIINTA